MTELFKKLVPHVTSENEILLLSILGFLVFLAFMLLPFRVERKELTKFHHKYFTALLVFAILSFVVIVYKDPLSNMASDAVLAKKCLQEAPSEISGKSIGEVWGKASVLIRERKDLSEEILKLSGDLLEEKKAITVVKRENDFLKARVVESSLIHDISTAIYSGIIEFGGSVNPGHFKKMTGSKKKKKMNLNRKISCLIKSSGKWVDKPNLGLVEELLNNIANINSRISPVKSSIFTADSLLELLKIIDSNRSSSLLSAGCLVDFSSSHFSTLEVLKYNDNHSSQ